jgi:uncharacterized integral membrane protein
MEPDDAGTPATPARKRMNPMLLVVILLVFAAIMVPVIRRSYEFGKSQTSPAGVAAQQP